MESVFYLNILKNRRLLQYASLFSVINSMVLKILFLNSERINAS